MVVAMAATAVGSIFYIQEFAKIDPLVNMRKGNIVTPDELGITLGKVKLVQYSGNKRVAEATVDRVFIPSNRTQYQMQGVHEGAYLTKDGKNVKFSAPTALWNATGRILTADDARIWNKDIDLKTPLFRVNQREDALYVPGTVRGRFYGGLLTTMNLRYDLSERHARFGPFTWDGNLALNLQDGGQAPRRQWLITSDGGDISDKKGIRTATKGTATDGDIIVKADKIVHEFEPDIVTATGNVKYFSAKANMSCAKAVIFRREKRAVLTGAVDMLVKPKDKQTKAEVVDIPPFRPIVPKEVSEDRPGAPPVQRDPKESQLDDDVQNAKTMRSYPTAITAAKIEYWYGRGSRRAVITGDPQARQELPGGRWRHVWAYEALYNGETEFLTLKSQPGKAQARAQTSLGDDILAETVIVSTKEDEDDLEAKNVKARIFGKSDDDDGPGPKGPDPIRPGNGGGLQGPIGRGRQP